eukprot:5401260-Pyramimonas_sp.AAC.1
MTPPVQNWLVAHMEPRCGSSNRAPSEHCRCPEMRFLSRRLGTRRVMAGCPCLPFDQDGLPGMGHEERMPMPAH